MRGCSCRGTAGFAHVSCLAEQAKILVAEGEALYKDDGATLDEVREVMTTLEDAERIARRVLGNLHPTTEGMRRDMQVVRAALAAREQGTS